MVNISNRVRKHGGLLLLLIALFFSKALIAQDSARQAAVTRLVDTIRSYNDHRNIEKVYVHLDKTHYLNGDTIWFKAYLFEAAVRNSPKSGLMYIEIASDSNKVVTRMMLPMVAGMTWGNIDLNLKDYPEGTYTFRAYTNWMRNFGEDYIFSKSFSVSDPRQQSWLLNYRSQMSTLEKKDHLGMSFQLRNLNRSAVGLRPLRLRLMDGRKILYRAEKETSLYGEFDLQLAIPDKITSTSLSLVAEDLRPGEGNRKVNIPISLNRAKNIDLQFMPEGGHLVAGLTSIVAFKAISENGKGANLSGIIMNGKQHQVASFSASHMGMGTFTLTPLPGETYIARATLPDGTQKDYQLPAARNSGTVIKVSNFYTSKKLDVVIQCSPDLLSNARSYNLVAQNNGEINYAASILIRGALTRVRIDKNLFVSGVSRLSLLDEANLPVNERLVYLHRKDNLDIRVGTNKPDYYTRDSVALNIEVRDQAGNPVVGSFSLSVTDDNRIRPDSLLASNILSKILVESELKGAIEKPGYYVSATDTAKAWHDLNILLMTQGWVSFNWPEVFMPRRPMLFPVESEFTISGRVINMFNKGVGNTELILFSKKPLLVLDTLTDASGRFNFRNLPQADTSIYVIQTRNKRGKSFNVGIEVDEFVPPVFTPIEERFTPWFINTDTIFLESTQNIVKDQHRYDAPAGVNVLEEVVVTAKKTIPLSRNKNGSGNADIIIDEEELKAAKKMTLFELLEKRFPGFRKAQGMAVKEERIENQLDSVRFVLLNSIVNLVIDGVNVREAGSEESVYMDYLTAEDITGVEIMQSAKYGLSYDRNFIKKKVGCLKCPPPPIYIELTTRSGNGAFMKKTPGVYLYKPMAFSFPKDFYRPKYTVKEDKPPLADLRSTIHWEPNIITNAEGMASILFYSADLPGKYSYVLEGTDFMGRPGSYKGKILIKENEK